MNFFKYLNKFLSTIIFVLTILILAFSFGSLKKKRGYEFFVEFNSAYGLRKGTNVNLQGVTVGYVNNLAVRPSKVVVLIHINSVDIMIPSNSLIEANQIGLFNDIIIDITLLDHFYISDNDNQSLDPNSLQCLQSSFICSNFYVKGYKGLNYDDLVRATTRISQRFDDPRFFNLFYILLQNSIDISSQIVFITSHASYLFFYLTNLITLLLSKYLI
uniref:Mce/MlaD domain-containing protein n=1 Tax=Laurenciella marilzae TaxID=1413812 RepID=A0A1Z1M1T8_9FLOR|nr:hypothetical protein [Laurenciella marilzae]ARW59744.1 hypothetical protein [Laurenciella marilzae]